MENRINIGQLEPNGYKALLGLESYMASTKIEKKHKELIKIRASQINGCAFCINMHTKDARKNGETEERIYLLNAWREVNGLYSEEERAILALTEEMTLIAQGGVSKETYQKLTELFDENYIAQLMMMVITINGWNRLSVATLTQPDLG